MILHVNTGAAVGLHVGSDNIKAQVSENIVMRNPPYEGATEVTPTEETQTLHTEGFALDSDITVDAVPSDYVGSGITRRTSADMWADGPNIVAPAGYYANAFNAKAVNNAAMATVDRTLTPSITVNSAGLITASVSAKGVLVKPVDEPGYVNALHRMKLNETGSNTKQLDTVEGTTIVPSETASIAVPAKRWTKGNVNVAAIPSDYVGSQVPQKSSADLSASGDTVSVPAGYYAADASKAVDAATWKNASTVGVVPDISVDANGLITADAAGWTSIHPLTASGYADKDTAANIQLAGVKTKQLDTLGANSYTPTKQTQTINGGVFLTGAQTINPIPDNYYDMSAFMSFLGKDVECVIANAYTKNFALKDTDWHGWTPSTTAQVLIASVNASQTFTATDMVNNEYFIVWECGVTPVYNSGYTDKARPLKSRAVIIQELCRRPSTIGNVESANFNGNVCVTANSSSALTYWNAATTPVRTITWSASYGFYFGATAATFSNSTNDNPTVTIKTPTLSARCSTTYMSTANAGKIDEENSTGFIKASVYRIKRNGEFRSVYEMLVAAFNA